jgi:RNA polymerase sigma-70 factor (ECF subfamily)
MNVTLVQRTKTATDPERWLDQHGDYLYSFAMSRLREPEAAEEMVQETLLAALQSRNKFAGQCSERTWLVSILKHKIVDHFRKASRQYYIDNIERLPSEREEPFETEGKWRGHWRVSQGMGPIDWGADPAADLERSEFWRVFERCLVELPPRLAQAFTLREIDALSSEEVCEVLNISPNNLWVMLHRARMQLRRSLEIHWFGAKAHGVSL